ncbi:cell division protein ZipA [Shewanella maritima]|uniref:Cell division protein ZipA n=2 Tax=Shewanella maritima TaxID=2520507 RepID=A0A411PDI4_9GAMM|nr:cell division protein ZipA [Shewanella maritima]QBF81613.1 cell division protein ZipA [Shewanella maritima]
MKDLQLVLFILGALAIVGVLVHGFWSIRRQQPKSMKESPMVDFYKEQSKRDADGFDADGVGEVRVRKADDNEPQDELDDIPEPEITPPKQTASSASQLQHEPKQQALFADTDAEDEKSQQKEPEFKQEPSFSDKDHDFAPINIEIDDGQAPDITLELSDSESSNLQAGDESAVEQGVDVTAKDAPQPASGIKDTEQQTTATAEPQEPVDVLVLHVVAKEGEQLQGAELLPCLLSLNFKFGEMDIFHRHIDNAGKGEKLFSLANMMKPGVFDPDNMEQFVTQGVVLFMTLPSYNDATMNFTIMLNSALQMVDDLGAELLDDRRQPWNDETRQQYIQRIRDAA